MKKDIVIIWSTSLFLLVVLFFNLFVLNVFENKYIFCAFLLIYFFIVNKCLGINSVYNSNKKNVIFIVTVFAVLYILFFYIIGIFVGFYNNILKFGFTVLYSRIIPYSGIIVLSELIRSVFIRRENKKLSIITTISLILIDVVSNVHMYDITELNAALELIGNVILSAISINLFCNYTNKRYGSIPGICYRLITTLYIYAFALLPDVYAFFESIVKIAYPYIMYLVIDYTFTKDNFKMMRNRNKGEFVGLVIMLFLAVGTVMLISCKFRYGIVVIASGSMTGSIDKGDAVVFEQYTEQPVNKGTVIIFDYEDRKTVHRVIDVQQLNGENIYYTKGDANQQADDGYRTKEDIMAIVKFKVIDIGWPTIFVNELFAK